MKKKLFFFTVLGFMALCTAQKSKVSPIRMQKAEMLFRETLIKYFIHPEQLDAQNWVNCQGSIKNLLDKFEEDFVDIRLEKAFKSSPVTYYFTPIFIYADGREFTLPAFKIMQ